VGTSFSVGVTEKALAIAQEFGKKVYSFNLYAERREGAFPRNHTQHTTHNTHNTHNTHTHTQKHD
jgi:hypothetical protein